MTWDGTERRSSKSEFEELRDLLVSLDRKLELHIATEQDMSQALKDLVIVWKGSKIILPFLASVSIGIWAIYEWAKDHLK